MSEVYKIFQCRLQIVGGKRKRKTKSGFKTKREVREAGKLAQQTYENIGQPIEPSEISVADFLINGLKMIVNYHVKKLQ